MIRSAVERTDPPRPTGPQQAHDPEADVFALGRTLAGDKTGVLVLNNQRTTVDLAMLSGGGVDVNGIFTNGATLTEIIRNIADRAPDAQ